MTVADQAVSPSATYPLESAEARRAIREQLERILASSHFKNSKRYPALLRYVVLQTLDGRSAELKERTLGVEVFKRDCAYETNLDPVVRMTAGEIRKRIAQYYHEPGHGREIRIELPIGTYVPEFRFPTEKTRTTPIPDSLWDSAPRRRTLIRTIGALATPLLVALAFSAWTKPWTTPTTIDEFWRPMTGSLKPVLICVGRVPHRPGYEVLAADMPDVSPRGIALPDVITLASITSVLQARGQAYQIIRDDNTSLTELRDAPAIFIGASNNSWSFRFMKAMRFSFHNEGELYWIEDRQDPASRTWSVRKKPVALNKLLEPLNINEDYALVSRVLNPTTGRIDVTVGGLSGYATTAAGEFLTNPSFLDLIRHQAPRGWEKKNIQVVIGTEVINGASGPPQIMKTWVW